MWPRQGSRPGTNLASQVLRLSFGRVSIRLYQNIYGCFDSRVDTVHVNDIPGRFPTATTPAWVADALRSGRRYHTTTTHDPVPRPRRRRTITWPLADRLSVSSAVTTGCCIFSTTAPAPHPTSFTTAVYTLCRTEYSSRLMTIQRLVGNCAEGKKYGTNKQGFTERTAGTVYGSYTKREHGDRSYVKHHRPEKQLRTHTRGQEQSSVHQRTSYQTRRFITRNTHLMCNQATANLKNTQKAAQLGRRDILTLRSPQIGRARCMYHPRLTTLLQMQNITFRMYHTNHNLQTGGRGSAHYEITKRDSVKHASMLLRCGATRSIGEGKQTHKYS